MPPFPPVKLGWRNPAANILSGPDAENLRRIFDNLDLWLTFPLFIATSATVTVPTATDLAIPWQTELYDEYTLHAANSATIRCPSQFKSYLAIGAASIKWADNSTAGYREFSWRVNGTQVYQTYMEAAAINRSVRQALPFMYMVKPGDTMDITVRHNNGVDHSLSTAIVGCVFLPMGS